MKGDDSDEGIKQQHRGGERKRRIDFWGDSQEKTFGTRVKYAGSIETLRTITESLVQDRMWKTRELRVVYYQAVRAIIEVQKGRTLQVISSPYRQDAWSWWIKHRNGSNCPTMPNPFNKEIIPN